MWHDRGMETVVLLGLYPPTNIERSLTDTKRSLFRTFATVSAMALGPVIPLCYRAEPIEPPDRRNISTSIALSASQWQLVDGSLMLGVQAGRRLEELTRALNRDCAESAAGVAIAPRPVPLHEGMFICSLQEASSPHRWPGAEPGEAVDEQHIRRFLKEPPVLHFTGSSVVCWRLNYGDVDSWWDNVQCEELWRLRLRKNAG